MISRAHSVINPLRRHHNSVIIISSRTRSCGSSGGGEGSGPAAAAAATVCAHARGARRRVGARARARVGSRGIIRDYTRGVNVMACVFLHTHGSRCAPAGGFRYTDARDHRRAGRVFRRRRHWSAGGGGGCALRCFDDSECDVRSPAGVYDLLPGKDNGEKNRPCIIRSLKRTRPSSS